MLKAIICDLGNSLGNDYRGKLSAVAEKLIRYNLYRCRKLCADERRAVSKSSRADLGHTVGDLYRGYSRVVESVFSNLFKRRRKLYAFEFCTACKAIICDLGNSLGNYHLRDLGRTFDCSYCSVVHRKVSYPALLVYLLEAPKDLRRIFISVPTLVPTGRLIRMEDTEYYAIRYPLKCVFSYLSDALRNYEISLNTDSIECGSSDSFKSVGKSYLLKSVTPTERLVIDHLQGGRKYYLFKLIAVRKSSIINMCNAFGNDDASQHLTASEYVFVESLYSVGKSNLLKIFALCKRLVAYFGKPIGKDDLLDARMHKRAHADALERRRKLHGHQALAILERPIRDMCNSLGDHYALNILIVPEYIGTECNRSVLQNNVSHGFVIGKSQHLAVLHYGIFHSAALHKAVKVPIYVQGIVIEPTVPLCAPGIRCGACFTKQDNSIAICEHHLTHIGNTVGNYSVFKTIVAIEGIISDESDTLRNIKLFKSAQGESHFRNSNKRV